MCLLNIFRYVAGLLVFLYNIYLYYLPLKITVVAVSNRSRSLARNV